MKKTVLVMLSLVFSIPLAYALALDTPSGEYSKGDKIIFTIECTQSRTNNLSVKSGNRVILDSDFLCPASGGYSYSLETSFLDLAGKWVAELSSTEGSAFKEITMNEKREAGFLLIRFMSPAEGSYFRGEKLSINAEIRDAGEPVVDANAVFWGAKGEKIFLENKQNGTYFFEYGLPLDAKPGDFELEVLAEKNTQTGHIGGKSTLKIRVQISPILIEIIEPKASTFDFGEQVTFSIKATYPNGKTLVAPDLKVSLGGRQFPLSKTAENIFEASPTFSTAGLGATEAVVSAADSFGNSSEKKLSLVITCSPTCMVKQYGLLVLGVAVIIFVAGRAVLSRAREQNELTGLEKEKQKTLSLIKSLQSEYFGKGIMPASSYKKNLADYKEKIVEIGERIKNLKETKK
ncbi:MAG: hypothetical protein Q7K34_04545 [archaeon]|nr:hypothetical protein [archaeon]